MSIYSKCWSDMYALYHKCISDLPADFKNNLKKKLPKNQLEKYYQQYFYEASLYYIKDLSDKGYLTPSALCDEFMGAQLFKKEQKGEIQNIYLSTKELKDFLFETPIKSIDGIKEYIKLHGEDSEDVVDGIDVINKAFLFNLHVPQEINGFTCRIWVQEDDAIIVWIKYDKLYVHWRFDPDNNYAEDLYRLQKCEDKEMKYPVQMILNLIYYRQCFPDLFVDGVPNTESSTSQENHILRVAPEILEPANTSNEGEAGSFKRPHFRSGYFRHLNSEWYKAKRGAIIWVNATFVGKANATATTVLENKQYP